MLRNFFYNLKHGTEHLNYGRDIVNFWASKEINNIKGNETNVIDLGAGFGTDLMNLRKVFPDKKLALFSVERYKPYIGQLTEEQITVFDINIENEPLPLDDGHMDIVIANQIIEHTKEIFWIFGEISRVLKKGGMAIIGMPNLAALHNRLMLFFGEQPSSIEIMSEHIRGFTIPAFKRFISCGGFFQIEDIKGANFYPVPPPVSKILSGIFPSLSVSIFFSIRRTDKAGNFIDILSGRFFETPYFTGK